MPRLQEVLVLDDIRLTGSSGSRYTIWLDSLAIPTFVAGVSAFILLAHLLWASCARHLLRLQASPTADTTEQNASSDVDSSGRLETEKTHVATHGGPIIFGFKVVRLIGCFALLSLSLATLVMHDDAKVGNTNTQMMDPFSMGQMHAAFMADKWLQFAMCISYAYACLLAILSVSLPQATRGIVTVHLVLLLVVTWSVYFYRDLWPLATYTKMPMDLSEGWILWSKTTLLTLTAIILPLSAPRQYIPVDPEDPMEPNPEQTASIISFTLWSFLDPIVFAAYRTADFSSSQLPPLADYDHARFLVKRSFKHLDPFNGGRRTHLFWGMMKIFYREFLVGTLMTIIRAVFGLAGPLAINRILYYLEHREEVTVVRPWVWIICLFLGPLINAVSVQYYFHLMLRTAVRMEAIITQLIFEHSLRIRMVADVSESDPTSTAPPTIVSSDSASVADPVEAATQSTSVSSDDILWAASESMISSSSKSKQKSEDKNLSDKAASSGNVQTETNAQNLVGKINNLVTSDLGNITDGRDFLVLFIYAPIQVGLCIIFLYNVVGWSAFVGFASMILLMPLPGYLAKLIQSTQVEVMNKMDARVQAVTETMSVIRMIKLFGWEIKMSRRLDEKREDELKWVWKRKVFALLIDSTNALVHFGTMVFTFMTYTMVLKRELNASLVFSSMAVFDILGRQLELAFYLLPVVVQGKVSLNRVDEFLATSELLDSFSQRPNLNDDDSETISSEPEGSRDEIGFRDASFSWSSKGISNYDILTHSRRPFILKIDEELLFKKGGINLVIGPTGSGKTSLLMALLGEMHYMPTSPRSWFNLPRAGGVAYAAQESWIQNDTIRENILFGAPYSKARYEDVIYQCGLQPDLALFDAGDQTEVGEKGLTLSGGQKARITLARAVYSSAQTLLLDDILAALDVHTAKWIVSTCLTGALMHGRTIVLATHNVAITSSIACFVVSLGVDGRILSQGSVSDALAKDHKLLAEAEKDEELIAEAETDIDGPLPEEQVSNEADGKLIVAEEVAEGRVSWMVVKLFIGTLGGILFWTSLLSGLLVQNLLDTLQVWYLGYWASKYEEKPASEVSTPYYVSIFGLLALLSVALYITCLTVYIYGSLKASRTIHKTLVASVLGSTLRWIDQTPSSRITTRFTQDIRTVDGPISDYLIRLLDFSISMLVKFGAVIVLTPVFLVLGATIAIFGGWVGQIYMTAELPVKREMSNAKSPVLSHFGAAIEGLISIRAYGAQPSFKRKSLDRIDRYTRVARTFWDLERWVTVRLDALGGLFVASLAAYLTYGHGTIGASDAGFSLTVAVFLGTMTLEWVRTLNAFEISGNSLERIQSYIAIEQEPKARESGIPPAYWPASGDLRVERLSARYSQNGPKVLDDISFHIKSGERIGVVGRTGSGKSSLTLSLLRCIFTDGIVFYDGIPTSSLNLDALRSNITIIPQVPELLSGSIRQNLDPFFQHDDATLNDALRAAGFRSGRSDGSNHEIALDAAVYSGGNNFSVGERQLLALARAIVRESKLLILDEATSAIDAETDSIIQTSLRRELKDDVTILTIAHRLQTIMDTDKIMVLEAGRIVEFDSPAELLKNKQGMLRALVDESVDKDMLYVMAAGQGI